ncbi:MAG: hypothetical protein ACK525_14690, partial [Microcystis sp.]
GVIPEVATVILSPNEDGIEQITAFLQQNPQITTTTSIIKSVRYPIALHTLQANLCVLCGYDESINSQY